MRGGVFDSVSMGMEEYVQHNSINRNDLTKTPPRQAASKIIWAKLRVRTLWERGGSQTTADSESLGRGTPLEL